MPPRKRNAENRGLPARWRFTHGAYYYCVPPGLEHLWDGKKQFRLGGTLPEAYQAWAERMESDGSEIRTIADLLDRYALEVVPTKARATQAGNSAAIKKLRAVFGHMAITAFKPAHAYGYRDRRGKSSPTGANRELEVLSHAFTKAIEWGALDRHPMIEGKFRKLPTAPRERYVEDWEVVEALSLPARRKRGSVLMLQAYIELKLLTGLRRGDLLSLRESDVGEDGITVRPRKTAKTSGKRIMIEWSPALREAVARCRMARPKELAPWLFCNRYGEPMIGEDGRANGFDSLWQRFMARCLAETKLEVRFSERDLRAKCATDAESLEHAMQLLAHADRRTTAKWYRRGPERVRPLR